MNPFFNLPTRMFIMLSLLLGAICLSACGKTMLRLKTTVNVEYDGVIYSESGVHQLNCKRGNPLLQGFDLGGCNLKGEAIPVKIGDKGYLFLVLAGEEVSNPNVLFYALTNHTAAQEKKSKSWDVNLTNAPLLVTFGDLNDPKSVKAVYPVDKEVVDHYDHKRAYPGAYLETIPTMKTRPANIKEIFGANISLKSINVERTKEPVTFGRIDAILPWLKALGDNNLEGRFSSSGPSLSGMLSSENFIWN